MRADNPIAIQVEDLHKTFHIPTHRVDSFKERMVRPFAARDYRELRALDGVSFEVRQGEFFGIVGRNGSGKSTLLKLLASIYRADSGTIRMAGRLAPFIELGVGFNHELSARENVVLNGVMMGLTPREMRRRLGAIIEFAELAEFADLKLKNYSSGMLVRLAFAVMMEVDADVLLIDEVLAVGDASFQQKCADAFHEMKAAGKTIILVTHGMDAVEDYCHRAMLIHDGNIEHLGEPGEVGRRYLQLNFENAAQTAEGPLTAANESLELLDAWLEDSDGDRLTNLEAGVPIRLRLELGVKRDVDGFYYGFQLADADGVGITELGASIGEHTGWPATIPAGKRVKLAADIDNPLAAGRYFVHCAVNPFHGGGALYAPGALDFVVFGAENSGLLAPQHEVEATIEDWL
jgi:ABC-type polysaccharide/polyol phosphate transport system ATPase subunit